MPALARTLCAVIIFLLCATTAHAQTVICPVTPDAGTSNQVCANTAFVHKAIGATNPTGLPFTVATLPAASSSIGVLAVVTDGTAGLAWGATVTGGHSTPYLVWSNGTAWTVVGK